MTVFINARFLAQPLTGVQRYGRELVGALDRLLAQDLPLHAELGPVIALHPRDVLLPEWRVIRSRAVPGGAGHAWEQGPLWYAARRAPLLSLGGSGPLAHGCHIVAFHDANPWRLPGSFSWRYRRFHTFMRPRLARRAARCLAVSRYAAQELREVLGVPDFTIVPNSAEHILRSSPDPAALHRAGLTPGGYLLTLGTGSPNKNLDRLARAHACAGGEVLPLVAAGRRIDCLRASTGLRTLGPVSDGALRALMEGAAGFVFPSLSEGFGIPPLEAMTLGTPVLAARSGALPETLGAAPLWFDPGSVPDMTEALLSFSRMGAASRGEMIEAGHRQAARFGWKSSAQGLAALLRHVVRERGVKGGHWAG